MIKLVQVAGYSNGAKFQKTREQLHNFDKQQIAKMETFIEAGANPNAVYTNDRYKGVEQSPLTQAIQSLRAQKVEILLKRGARSGDIGWALRDAGRMAELFSNASDLKLLEMKKNFNRIKKMLSDKGLN